MEKNITGSYKRGRKAQRKQTRYVNMLFRDTGLKCMDVPTSNLFIGNAGLVSGLKREDLLQIFSSFGRVRDVFMIPGKSYSFVAYHDATTAEKAFNAVHGKQLTQLNCGCLYVAYAEKLPNTEKLDSESDLPSGLELLENYVTLDEEEMLLNSISWSEGETAQHLKHRKVQHYGFEFHYDINNVDKNNPLSKEIPKECDFLINRLKEKGFKYIPVPDQLTINQYSPGQGIPSHIDTHSAFTEHILSLSLGSSIVMEFEHCDGRSVSVLLPQRSLLIMSGEARYAWRHGITPRKMDVIRCKDGGLTVMDRGTRTSFTFRKILHGDCECFFHDYCDTFQKNSSTEEVRNEELACRLEALHVHKVYQEIANHFSETRHKPWPNVVKFLSTLPHGSILVDVGCGNGKYFGTNADIFEVGCDQSTSLARVCQERGFQVFSCNCLMLPLRSGIADGCINIAVIHHLSTQERRVRAIEEMARILRHGGCALVYVWARNQECGKVKSNYLRFAEKRKDKRECNVVSSTSNTKCDTVSMSLSVDENSHSTCEVNRFESGCCKTHKKKKYYCSPECNEDDGHSLTKEECKPDHTIGNNTENNEPGSTVDMSTMPLNRVRQDLPQLPVHTNRTQFKHSDVLVPWKLKQGDSSKGRDMPVLYRYYHVFEEGELEKMCAGVEGIKVINSYYDQGNWCVIFAKL